MLRIFTILSLITIGFTAFCGETDVVVRNDDANIELAGTLALPEDRIPDFFIVFASGSGAQNRDEEVFGHRPFKVLSDTLTAEGYGTLRMDDRGVGQSTGQFETAVLEDFTGDVLSGVKFLRERYPKARIGILGHSQGGQVAVKAAARGEVDFIVTLAGPAWKGDSLIMSQCRALAVATTGSWQGERMERKLLDIAMTDVPPHFAKLLLYDVFAEQLGDMMKVPEMQERVYAQIEPLVSPMYHDLLRYDPTDDIKAVDVPWIALNGDKDLQVIVGNLDTIKELNPNAVTLVMEDHNHLFQPAITGLPTEYHLAGKSPSDKTIETILYALNKYIRRTE